MNTTSTGDFLGEADFEGQPIRATGPIREGGQATYNGVLTFTNVARASVESLLPSNFQLSPRKTPRLPKLHPVILLFGDQTDGVTILGKRVIPSGIHYSEMIFAIPFVQKTKQPGWHTYIIRMYLDNDWAVGVGMVFAYQKKKAWIDWTGDHAKIWGPASRKELLEGDFRWGAQWYDGNDALQTIPNFQDMVNIMTTRILGVNFLGPICSQFEWNLEQAQVAKAETSYTMKAPFRSNMSAWPDLSPFKNVTDGAVVVRGLRWRLASRPIQC